jgi:Nif-specific regulatory protein
MKKTEKETVQELQHKVAVLSILYEVSRTLSSCLDLRVTLHAMLEILSDRMAMRRGSLILVDPETLGISTEVALGLSFEEKKGGGYKIGEPLLRKVMETGEFLIVLEGGKEVYGSDPARLRADFKRDQVAVICTPVRAQGKAIGILSVDRLFSDLKTPIQEDLRVLDQMASLVSQAVLLYGMMEQEKREWVKETRTLQLELKSRYRFSNIVCQSEKMRAVLDEAWRVSLSKATVMLRGESGTGKELIARAIHYNSPRCDKPFIKLNCAAMTETLIESELFGHEKGAFTGASYEKKGRFELANEGTLFLDEVGDIPLSTQVKLLRVLQERKFERVGGTKTLSVDVRIIAATNRDLEEAIRDGSFREDLYYRLNVVPIVIPTLRDRKEDILLLVGHFLQLYNEENQKNVKISNEALDTLLMYDWPGNVRELENCMERMIVMAKNELIMAEDVPVNISDEIFSEKGTGLNGKTANGTLTRTLEEMERDKILEALKRCGGVQARAAKLLGITPRQIGYKVKKYGVDLGEFGI